MTIIFIEVKVSVTSQKVLIIQTKMKKEKNKWLVDDVQVKGNG
ncbi:hypothetical protein [Pseudomonas sp. ISL-88]|nr:hypothetical protein [Pseudomonas sp. ISL-88]